VETYIDGDTVLIGCTACLADGPYYPEPDSTQPAEAVKLWDTRPIEAALIHDIERAAEANGVLATENEKLRSLLVEFEELYSLDVHDGSEIDDFVLEARALLAATK